MHQELHGKNVSIIMSTNIPRAHLNKISLQYIDDVKQEKADFHGRFPLTAELINHAIDKVHTTGRVPGKEYHCDVSKPVPMKLTERVSVPINLFPTFNFVGKILGPQGNTLRRLEQNTQCKICIKGRNSMRDSVKEEELRRSGEPEYAHLNRSLFIEISTVGLPVECYSRIALALEEIRPYLIPDKNDEISLVQWKETGQMLGVDVTRFPKFSAQKCPIQEPAPLPPTPPPPPFITDTQPSPKPFVLKSILKKPKHEIEPPDSMDKDTNSSTDPGTSSINQDVGRKTDRRVDDANIEIRELKGSKLKRTALPMTSLTPKRVCASPEY